MLANGIPRLLLAWKLSGFVRPDIEARFDDGNDRECDKGSQDKGNRQHDHGGSLLEGPDRSQQCLNEGCVSACHSNNPEVEMYSLQSYSPGLPPGGARLIFRKLARQASPMIRSPKPAFISLCIILLAATLAASGVTSASAAAPRAEAARRCMHYSYIAYPFKRPGSVHMSPDRQAYFRDCMAKDGNVPEPPAPNPDPASADIRPPKA